MSELAIAWKPLIMLNKEVLHLLMIFIQTILLHPIYFPQLILNYHIEIGVSPLLNLIYLHLSTCSDIVELHNHLNGPEILYLNSIYHLWFIEF